MQTSHTIARRLSGAARRSIAARASSETDTRASWRATAISSGAEIPFDLSSTAPIPTGRCSEVAM